MRSRGSGVLVHGSVAWLGPGEALVEDAVVVLEGSRVAYAGRAERASEADESIEGDWFLMPAAVAHHVHIGLADARAVLDGGVTAVRDLAWPADSSNSVSRVLRPEPRELFLT